MEEEEEPEHLSRRVVLAQLDKAGRDLANYVRVACSASCACIDKLSVLVVGTSPRVHSSWTPILRGARSSFSS